MNSNDKIAFKTKRLEAHFLNEENQQLLIDLYQSEGVASYLKGLDANKDIALTLSCYKENQNIGAYLIFCSKTKELIGFGGVHNQEPLKDGSFALEEDIEFIIILNQKYFGQGFAKEFCQEFLHLFFSVFKKRTLLARVSKDNISCLKLLEKLGFKNIGETFYYDKNNKFELLELKQMPAFVLEKE